MVHFNNALFICLSFPVSDKNRDYAFNQTFVEPNPACTISAALTYTSQLVKQISFFLDVFLPRRPNFRCCNHF